MYRGLVFFIFLALMVGALFAPVRLPYSLVSIGNVEPSEEWRLVQDGANSLSAVHQNFKTGMVERLASWQFERGDLAGMEVTVRPDTFGLVVCGDTVIRMYSVDIQQQILDLESQLQIAESTQTALISGEKPPIVEEAESKLVFAKEALTLRQKEFDITEKLEKEGAVAKLDLTRSKNVLDLAKIDVKTAEKSLEVAQTGVKTETASVNKTQISTLRARLSFLRSRAAKYFILSPFDGVVSPIREAGQILNLQKISEYVLSIPVRAEQLIFISENAKITVRDQATGKVFHAKFLRKEHQTQIVGGKNVGFVKATIYPEKMGERLTSGLAAECTVACDSLNPREYLKRILHFNTK